MRREAAKKIKLFFSGPATKRGGVRAWPLRKRNLFEAREKKFPPKNVATKLEGDGGVRPQWPGHLKKFSFAASLIYRMKN